MSKLAKDLGSVIEYYHRTHEKGGDAWIICKLNDVIDEINEKPTIADYLKANEAMLTKTKAKMVSIESLKEFAGIK